MADGVSRGPDRAVALRPGVHGAAGRGPGALAPFLANPCFPGMDAIPESPETADRVGWRAVTVFLAISFGPCPGRLAPRWSSAAAGNSAELLNH